MSLDLPFVEPSKNKKRSRKFIFHFWITIWENGLYVRNAHMYNDNEFQFQNSEQQNKRETKSLNIAISGCLQFQHDTMNYL